MALTDGDILKAVLTITCPELVIAQNVYYYLFNDPTPNNPTDAQVLTAFDTEFTALGNIVDQLIHSDYSWDELTVDRVEWNVDHWETVENIGVVDISVAGTSAGGAAPHGVAVTITANTTRPQTRARKFLPGFSEGEMANSTLSGTVLTALALFVIEWLNGKGIVGAATLDPVVLGQSGPSAGTVYPLVSAAANAITGYQRRRKPGVGS